MPIPSDTCTEYEEDTVGATAILADVSDVDQRKVLPAKESAVSTAADPMQSPVSAWFMFAFTILTSTASEPIQPRLSITTTP